VPKEKTMSNAALFLSVLSHQEFTELIRQKRSWLTRKQAAARLGVAVSTMEVWAAKGKGPAARKNMHTGSVRYHIDVIDEWMTGADQKQPV
jgi:Helix-turn-helix domain